MIASKDPRKADLNSLRQINFEIDCFVIFLPAMWLTAWRSSACLNLVIEKYEGKEENLSKHTPTDYVHCL